MYIDTHCHLTDDRYEDIDKIISEFEADSIEKAITVGYDLQSSQGGVELANKHARIFAVVGIHPHDAKTYSDQVEKALIELSKNKKVVAIGEIGLDYYYDLSPRETQREVFIKQLRLAKSLGLPIVLHIRDSYGEAFDILSANKDCLNSGGILHCYSGSAEMLDRFLGLGLYVSFSGAITFKNNNKADECIKRVPKDKILTETDCPYLTPMPYRGKMNYPKYVKYIAEKIADVYGMSASNLCEQVKKNVNSLFKI